MDVVVDVVGGEEAGGVRLAINGTQVCDEGRLRLLGGDVG